MAYNNNGDGDEAGDDHTRMLNQVLASLHTLHDDNTNIRGEIHGINRDLTTQIGKARSDMQAVNTRVEEVATQGFTPHQGPYFLQRTVHQHASLGDRPEVATQSRLDFSGRSGARNPAVTSNALSFGSGARDSGQHQRTSFDPGRSDIRSVQQQPVNDEPPMRHALRQRLAHEVAKAPPVATGADDPDLGSAGHGAGKTSQLTVQDGSTSQLPTNAQESGSDGNLDKAAVTATDTLLMGQPGGASELDSVMRVSSGSKQPATQDSELDDTGSDDTGSVDDGEVDDGQLRSEPTATWWTTESKSERKARKAAQKSRVNSTISQKNIISSASDGKRATRKGSAVPPDSMANAKPTAASIDPGSNPTKGGRTVPKKRSREQEPTESWGNESKRKRSRQAQAEGVVEQDEIVVAQPPLRTSFDDPTNIKMAPDAPPSTLTPSRENTLPYLRERQGDIEDRLPPNNTYYQPQLPLSHYRSAATGTSKVGEFDPLQHDVVALERSRQLIKANETSKKAKASADAENVDEEDDSQARSKKKRKKNRVNKQENEEDQN